MNSRIRKKRTRRAIRSRNKKEKAPWCDRVCVAVALALLLLPLVAPPLLLLLLPCPFSCGNLISMLDSKCGLCLYLACCTFLCV